MLSKSCVRSHGQPVSGSRSAAMMSSRRRSSASAEAAGSGIARRYGRAPLGASPLPCHGEADNDGAMEDEDGPPGLPGGKFYMTQQGHDQLKAELAATRTERHRVVEI